VTQLIMVVSLNMASPLLRTHVMPAVYDDGLFAVAPMMDYTNRFLRFMLRRVSSRATLYTEMVTSNTLVHCSEAELPRFLAHDGEIDGGRSVLQLGGASPEQLRAAVAIAEPWGYSAINLNCGCPSDRVAGSGCFGAAMMRQPELVADCCAAMSDGAGGRVPITVKCRIGVTTDKATAATVDDEPTYEELHRFVDTVHRQGGVRTFIIHARKAVLGGLSPAQNRQIPPLRYGLVSRLATDFPELRFSLNGGLETLADAAEHLGAQSPLSGVMLGRAVVARPWAFATADSRLYGAAADPAGSRRELLHEYCDYIAEMEAKTPQRIRHLLLAPAVNLFSGEPRGKIFRRTIDQTAKDTALDAAMVVRRASEVLLDETLDAPPGTQWDHREEAYVAPGEGTGAVAATA